MKADYKIVFQNNNMNTIYLESKKSKSKTTSKITTNRNSLDIILGCLIHKAELYKACIGAVIAMGKKTALSILYLIAVNTLWRTLFM